MIIIVSIIVSIVFGAHILFLLFGLISKDSNRNQNIVCQGGKIVGTETDSIIPIMQNSAEQMDTVVKGMRAPAAPVTSSFAGLQVRISCISTGQIFDAYLDNQLVIGREGGNALIQISDSKVSSKHCMLFRKGEQVLIQDLGSTNHTYLNGCILECPVPVCSGDIINIGNSTLQLQNIYTST